jgi:hypothetical protein
MSPGYQIGTGISVRAGEQPRRRWIWITVALVTALVIAAPVGFRLWLKAAHHNLTLPAQVYRQQLTQLSVVAPAGSVTLVPSGRPGVTVLGSLSWVFTRPFVAEALRGRTLQVTGSCPGPNPFEDCQVGLTIRVPVNLAVDVSAGSGSVTIRGLSGPLHLATTSGSITISRVGGPVWVSAGSGSVTGYGVVSPELDAVIGSGSLQLGLAATPRALNLAIASGSASITVPPGARMRTVVNTGAGLWHIAPGIADSGAAGTMTATIDSGVVTVGYSR